MTETTGRELADSLARKLRADRWLAVTEMQLFDQPIDGRHRRADLVAMRRNVSRPVDVRVFEIKISRSDFMADLRAEKWRTYVGAGRVYFACPASLVNASEVPTGAGLIELSPRGWTWKKQAPAPAGPPPVDLMRRLVMAAWDQATAETALQMRPPLVQAYRAYMNARTELGREAVKAAADLTTYRQWTETARAEFYDLSRRRDALKSEVRQLNLKLRHAELHRRPIEMADAP